MFLKCKMKFIADELFNGNETFQVKGKYLIA